MRRDKQFYSDFHTLSDAGVEVQKVNQIRYNSGSETHLHSVAKTLAGKILIDEGYAVSSEVEVPGGDIDVVAFGHPDRLSYAVEFENGPTDDVKASKLDRYVKQTPLDDMLLINLDECPSTKLDEIAEWLQSELGL